MSLQINPLTSNHSIRIIIPRFNAIMWRFRVNCYARSTNPYGTRLKIVTARYFWNVSTIVLPQIPLLGKRCSPKQYQRRSDKVNRNCFSFPQRFAVLFSWLHFLRQINSSLFCLKRHSAIWNIYKTNVYYGNCVYVSKEGLFSYYTHATVLSNMFASLIICDCVRRRASKMNLIITTF